MNERVNEPASMAVAHRRCLAAAAAGDLAVLREMQPALIASVDASGKRALHAAAEHGQVAVLEWLVESGIDANINKPDDDARSALHWAAWKGHHDAVEALIEMGALVTRPTRTGFTALHYAACSGSIDTIKVLLMNGASLTAKDESNRSPAELARFLGQTAAAEFLEEVAPDIAKKAGAKRRKEPAAVDLVDPLVHVAAKQEEMNLERVFQAAAKYLSNDASSSEATRNVLPEKPFSVAEGAYKVSTTTAQLGLLLGAVLFGVVLGGLLARAQR